MLLIIEDNLEAVHLYKIALQLVQIEPEVETSGPAALRRIGNASAPQTRRSHFGYEPEEGRWP